MTNKIFLPTWPKLLFSPTLQLFTILLFSAFLSFAQTDLRWDFKEVQKDGGKWIIPSVGSTSGNINTNFFSPDGGLDNGGALLCGIDQGHRVRLRKLADAAAAIEVTFSLNAAPTREMTLFTYQENTWGRAFLGISLSKESAFNVIINLNGTVKKKFTTNSKPVVLQPGQIYTLRVTLESQKMARLYLNGMLLKEDSGALCFSDFVDPPIDIYHPFATLGYSYWNCDTGKTLDGKIYQCAIQGGQTKATAEQSTKQAATTRINANIVVRQTSTPPAIDGLLNDNAWQNAEWSEPFLVLGSMSVTQHGLWETADRKFLQNASTAALVVDDNTIYAAVRAPFPAGMTPVAEQPAGGEIWRDDCVELFLHPHDGSGYYQLLVNAKGNWQGLKHPHGRKSEVWEPASLRVAAASDDQAFTVEVAIPLAAMETTRPTAGTAWTGNFAREGATCGGLSTWAPVGTSFLSPEQFGQLVFDERQAYFAQKVAKLQQDLQYYQIDAGETKAALTQFQAEAKDNQSLRADWTALHNRLTMLENKVIQELNAGKTHLLWQKELLENFSPNCRVPFDARELSKISLEAARGSRAISSFLVTNLTEQHLMTRLSFTAAKSSEALNPLVRFREVAFLELNGGKMIPDPIFDLPIGSMLRVAPGQSSVVWLDLDTSSLAPGKYAGKISLLPSYSGFEQKTIDLELTVRNVDLRQVFVRTWTYAVREPWITRALHEYGYNCVIPIPSHYYPQYNENGKPIFPRLEEMIQSLKDNGVPHKEIFLLFYPEFYQWANIKLDNDKWVTFMEPEWQTELAKRLLILRDWLTEQGFSYQQYAFYPTDEPNGDPEDPKSKAYFAFVGGKFIKSVDNNFQLFANPYKLTDGRHQQYFDLFEILEPHYGQMNPEIIKAYRESGREIWTYSIFEKSVGATRYRHIFWQNMAAGFAGPATFYDLTATNGDAFNSYDSSSNGKSVVDYATLFLDRRTKQLAVSRRQEAWYQGLMDFKLARYCQKKIDDRQTKGQNSNEHQLLLTEIIEDGFKNQGKLTEISKRLLDLAESLTEAEQK